jgi:regulatory protein
MQHRRHNRHVRPIDQDGLWRLALHYVGRYATTEAKLRDYLARKVRERGWADEKPADFEAISLKCAEMGYVDDRGYAAAKAGSLTRRGYGGQRIGLALSQAGIPRAMADEVMPDAEAAERAAESYARRKRIGRFGEGSQDPKLRQKQMAAMVRAGHSFALARQFVTVESGAIDAD